MKRDFQRTPEPSGQDAVKHSTRRRFVIQKHAATRLHYDLRLEMDGVFKSWAVPGPSLDPHDKRLAVEVEDHPLDYGDFEGTIPEGQYGGGTVLLWDRGSGRPTGRSPEQALAKGDLKFTLEGKRLHGGWVLVRITTSGRGKRTNWLLIKHRDEFAVPASGADGPGRGPRRWRPAGHGGNRGRQGTRAEAVHAAGGGAGRCGLGQPQPASRRRSARARAKAKASAAVMSGFIAPQLCDPGRPPSADGWVHEIKFDGYRIQMRVDGGAVLLTRKGLDWTTDSGLARPVPCCRTRSRRRNLALNGDGAPDFAVLRRPSPRVRPTCSCFSPSTFCTPAGRIYARGLSPSARSDYSNFSQKPATPVFASSSVSMQ